MTVPSYEWYGDTPVELEFPDGWKIHEQRMAVYDASPLTQKEIADKLQHPVGSPTLRELCRGKHKIVIIFDDMTRPTKTWQMLQPILDELRGCGIADDRVIFVMATFYPT